MSLDKLTKQQALIPMMSKLAKEFRALINKELHRRNIPLTKEQVIVLKILHDKDGCPQNDLALVTSRDKTSLTRLLSNMERNGLITRKQSKTDKRMNLIFLSRKGKSSFIKVKPIILKLMDKAVGGLEENDIDKTKNLIKNIYTNLNIQYEE